MAIFDDDGNCTVPERQGEIDPTHPNYQALPHYRKIARVWLRAHAEEKELTPADVPPPA